jgi:hypothetical protein
MNDITSGDLALNYAQENETDIQRLKRRVTSLEEEAGKLRDMIEILEKAVFGKKEEDK